MNYAFTTDQAVAESIKQALDAACGYPHPETLTYRAVEIITGPDEDQWLVPMPDGVYSHNDGKDISPRIVLPEERQQDEPIADVQIAQSTSSFHQQASDNRVVQINPDTGEPFPLGPDPNNFTMITEDVAKAFGFFPDDAVEAPQDAGGPIKGR